MYVGGTVILSLHVQCCVFHMWVVWSIVIGLYNTGHVVMSSMYGGI